MFCATSGRLSKRLLGVCMPEQKEEEKRMLPEGKGTKVIIDKMTYRKVHTHACMSGHFEKKQLNGCQTTLRKRKTITMCCEFLFLRCEHAQGHSSHTGHFPFSYRALTPFSQFI